MLHTLSPSAQDVAARKKSDRGSHLRQHALPVDHDFKPHDGVTNVQEYPQASLTDKQRTIVNCDATALAELIRKSVFTSTEVLEAFVTVTIRANDVTNCLTESCLKNAFERAAQLDQHLKETGQVIGPLHGLPVSIKDHIKVKGLDTSSGYIAWAYKTVVNDDALVVSILRKAGAIIYVKTQNPQTLLSLETDNNIFGRSVNPYNRKLTSGGSSGGEAALIACRGSVLGVGTDIGGSVRIPAAHCGLYGLKGSVARLPHSGLLGSHDGMDAIVGSVGPLARSARDLELFCRVMLDAEPWLYEPPLLEMPWKADVARGERIAGKKLTIAILYDDGVVAPHPPIAQALKKYEAELKKAGHEVILWEPLDHQKGWELILKLYFLDGGAEYWQVFREGGEPPVPQTKWILDQIQHPEPFAVDEIFRLNVERETFRAKALEHWNASRGPSGRPVDAILCPVAPTLAPPHDTTCWWGYTSHWNLLDLPAVVFPVGQYSASQPLPGIFTHAPRNRIEERVAGQWDPSTYDYAPISLQLVGRRHNEERLLAMLKVIEDVIPSNVPGGWMKNDVLVNGDGKR